MDLKRLEEVREGRAGICEYSVRKDSTRVDSTVGERGEGFIA